MKLTICQFSKLFLLLTAFFYILDQCNVLPASAIVTIKAETVSIVYDKDDDKNNNNNKHNNNNTTNNNNNKNNKDIKKFAKVKELYSSEIFRNLENSLETTTTTRTTTATLLDKLEDTLTKNEVSLLMKTLDNKQEQQEQQQEQQQQIEQVSTITTINERIAKDLNIGKSIEKLSKHNQSLYVRLKGSINKNENKNKNKNDNDNRNDSSNDYYNVDKNDDENKKNNNNNNNNDENENVNAKDNKASDVHSMTAAAGIDLKILSAHKLTTLVRDVENQQHFMANKQKATTKTTIIPSSTIILSNDFIWQKSKKQQQEQPQYKLRSSPTLLPSPLPSPTPSPLLSSLASILMPANKITSTSTTSASSSESRHNSPSSSMLHSNSNRMSSNSGNGSRSYRHTANTIKLQRQHQQEHQKEQQIERQHQRQQQQQQQQQRQQQQQQHKYQHQHEQRVGVLVPSALLNRMHVQQGFRNFMEFFQVNFKNVTVDFLLDDDWRHFVKLLEGNYYTMLVKTLNIGVDLHIGDNENDISNYSDADDSVANNHSQREVLQSQQRDDEMKTKTKSYDSLQQQQKQQQQQQQQQRSSNIGYCRLGKELARDFNKTVLLWPCPHIKESGSFLPSYEAISFAVKSIANKLNWTQVDIYVGDDNWALPMTIAANLHIPYKIVMGEDNIHSLHASDKIGKAIILTAVMNDISTLRLLNKLETLLYTKVLLIDIMAASFNAKNQFYKHLSRINPRSSLMSNLLLLTVLSDNYRHFLNVAFEDNGIQMVQNFRQLKRLKTIAITDSQHTNDSLEYWPNAKVLSQDSSSSSSSSTTSSDDKRSQLYLSDINHTNFTYKWLKACSSLNFFNINDNRHICQHQEQIIENCWLYLRNEQRKVNQREILAEHLIKDLRKLFTQQLCRKQPLYDDEQSSTVTTTKTTTTTTTFENIKRDQQLIANLREFIDFFNFYDFLIANILANKPANANQPRKHQQQQQHQRHVPKYDFIVLDVVLTDDGVYGGGDSNNNSQYNRINNTSSNNLLNAFNWRPLLILELHEINLKTYITHSIQPGFDDWLLVTNVQLWHCNTICWIVIAVCVGFLLFVVVASVAAGIALRNYLLKKRLSKGPNKIVLSANDFVFPVDSRRVDDGIEAMLRCWLQQLQEFGGPEVDKPDLLKGSIGSLKNLGFIIPGASTNAASSAGVNNATTNGKSSNTGANHLARHNPALLDMRARYNGDLVQLKEIQMNGSTELKAKAMDLLVMAHGLRHENINPLIGWLADPNRTAMVFDFCSRGSLQDVLIMDEIKLDWSFRLSLLTDLVRGMRYLHSSPLRIHGTLTSRNCVVDARWVLKITDYGLPLFYEAQGIQSPQRTAKELLWTAPELLRAMKPQPTPSHTHQQQQQQQHQQHHHHHHHYSYHLTHHARTLMGTPAGDVYSFGIIMQEVVVRGEPYCMLSLSADEIIAKIKKPPPLIRPSVSKGAAPPEAINIMRQCWAEQPEMRPDFNSVYERFKLLNHGRKVNFVDTMFQMLEKYSNNLEELIRERTEQLDMERKKTEQLLNRMLPSSVAEKLKMGLAVEPEEFSDVTIYFSDIVGFTTIAAHCTPVQVVDLLNDLYTIFDATINAYNVYKVETIGDAYMVVSGLPVRIPDHAEQIATMALDLLHQSGRFNVKHLPGVPLQLRIGLHTGPCCAGVVGLTMPRYCLFGDTVNTASRMESTGSSWRIHMSQETRDRLETRGGYMIEPRGLIDIKGKGMMNTFWLLGKKGFDKPLPNPPPIGESHGLDESLIRNSITLKALANKSRNSTNPSSSQSSSLAGEAVEVKVEITPPANAEVSSNHLQNSYSLDSNSTTTISPNMNLCPEFPSKTPSSSPQSRKISDATSTANVPEHLLCSTVSFNRLPNSAGGSSSRLYKKIEEMLDLSSPYNHYKCLSPSESNLSQFYDGKYIYSTSSGSGSGGNTTTVLANVINLHSAGPRFEKPGSSRLLRRQFSLDRDDTHNKGEYQLQHQHPHQSSLQTSYTLSLSTKSSLLDIPILQENSRSPKVSLARIHKQNSSSIAQDLEKIEEIPLSPASSQQHSSLDSNMNKSPPSTIETSIPPLHKPIQYTGSISPPQLQTQGKQITKTSTLFSAPTSPAPSRSLNGISYITGVMESPTTDASTATTSASVTSTQSTPADDPLTAKKSEISLNVEALLSR